MSGKLPSIFPPATHKNPLRRSVLALAAGLPLLAGAATTAQSLPVAANPAGGCTVTYSVASQWQNGFQGNVRITNHGPAISSWNVSWSFPSGQSIAQGWGGTFSQSGSDVSVQNAAWNGSLGSNGSADVGFIGNLSGANTSPTTFTLNGQTCTGPGTTTPAPSPTTSTPAPTPTPTPTTTTPAPSPTTTTPAPNPTSSGQLFLDTDTQAYEAWEAASGNDKNLLAKIALTPASRWIGDWDPVADSREQVRALTQAAHNAGKTASFVVYAIPGRDCGHYSGGGVSTSEYAAWIDGISQGIVGNPIVILEPDALAQLGDCDGQGDRVGFLKYAAQKLTQAGAEVYIDAGNSDWKSAEEIAQRLNQIGFQHAKGFSLNVSNYHTTADSRAYGERVSALTGGAKFVIDTSRNGNGSNSEWCNPSGRALGDKPQLFSSGALRGLLWIKLPGESDGTCNGGPSAGAWWQANALELARNAKW